MLEFVKQSKKRKLYCILGILYLLCIIFVANDAWLYSTPIAKLTKVETSVSGEETGTRGTKEKKYKQNIQGVILNGENKGKTISFTNECTYTGMMKQPYHKGDKVLLNGTSKRMGSGIRGLKRDTELMILIGFLMFILIIVAGRQGALTILTVIFNVAVFAIGFWKAGDTSNVLEMCSRLVILFAVITLVGLNGIHKKTWAALFTTLIVLVMIMGIFDVVIHHAEDLDYSTMEYLGSIENPDEIFHAEILISGLGAIMDVAITISSSISELIQKDNNISVKNLQKSAREIGKDIMSTMSNVLFFTYLCSGLPIFVLALRNGFSMYNYISTNFTLELTRFLIGSIGIVLTIPVSAHTSIKLMKRGVK